MGACQRSSHHWMTTLARKPRKPTPSPRNSTKVPKRPALDSHASWHAYRDLVDASSLPLRDAAVATGQRIGVSS